MSGEYSNSGRWDISALNIGEMALSFAVSYIFACIIGYFIPADRWGMSFAEVCKAEKGTWKYCILVNLVVNTFFCVVMTLFMTRFPLCVRSHAPLQAVPAGFLEMIGPVWVCCFFVSLFTQRPTVRLAQDCVKTNRNDVRVTRLIPAQANTVEPGGFPANIQKNAKKIRGMSADVPQCPRKSWYVAIADWKGF